MSVLPGRTPAALTPREKTAISLRNQGKTWREIGERFGVSVERARQIHRRGARVQHERAEHPQTLRGCRMSSRAHNVLCTLALLDQHPSALHGFSDAKIEWWTEPGNLVTDWYSGSGTTLLAAEKLGRVGYGMDITSRYVAVTLERLTRAGLAARRIG